ncbi:unnamed protein product [Amaranthus hypochondriacus]
MAEETIALDLARTGHDYNTFIQKIRDKAKDGKRHSHGRPVLPPKPKEDVPVEVFDVQLQFKNDHQLIVRIRRYDLYVMGYCTKNGQWFEFKNEDNIHMISGSQFLGFTDNYNDMGGLDSEFEVGYSKMIDVVKQLSNTTVTQIDTTIKFSMRLLCVMISEAARFDKLLDIFTNCMLENKHVRFKSWMKNLVNHWGSLSMRLLQDDAYAKGSFLLPEVGNGNLNQLVDPPLNIRNNDDVSRCLGILRGKYPPSLSAQEFKAILYGPSSSLQRNVS